MITGRQNKSMKDEIPSMKSLKPSSATYHMVNTNIAVSNNVMPGIMWRMFTDYPSPEIVDNLPCRYRCDRDSLDDAVIGVFTNDTRKVKQ